ncbi:hypothetical protein M9Y10_023953 [Tritrichomonas musculus]|uniref:Uncharacterized protein n=1 Tax=Tritrichomonas musculus TaxID=1915356 RepID=A0ABR2KYG0_9EUKA
MVMNFFQGNCKNIEGYTDDFCFCFSIIFLSDIISQILVKYEKSNLTEENINRLIECGIDLIKYYEKTPLIDYQKTRAMAFGQWSVIISIISEDHFTELISKFDSIFHSDNIEAITNTICLFRFLRLDLNHASSQKFLENVYGIMKNMLNNNTINELFFKSVVGLFITAPSEYIIPFYAILESLLADQSHNGININCINFEICLLMLKIPKFQDKIDSFFETKIYPAASDPKMIKGVLFLFAYYLQGGRLDPTIQFWEWGVFKRSPTLFFLSYGDPNCSGKKLNEKFMNFFFEISDFSVCPKLFSYTLVFLASVDFNYFVDHVMPRFLELPPNDSRFVTLLKTVHHVNSSDFRKFSKSKIESSKLNEFNSLLKEKVLNVLSSLKIDDKITAVSIDDKVATFSRVVEESDKIILETLRNWKLSQFSEVNIQHMKAEETVQDFSLEVQLLRALPWIMNMHNIDDWIFSESIMTVMLKMTFSLNSSISHEALLICRSLAVSSNRFVKVVINYLLERAPSSESLFICVSLIGDAVKSQLSIFRKKKGMIAEELTQQSKSSKEQNQTENNKEQNQNNSNEEQSENNNNKEQDELNKEQSENNNNKEQSENNNNKEQSENNNNKEQSENNNNKEQGENNNNEEQSEFNKVQGEMEFNEDSSVMEKSTDNKEINSELNSELYASDLLYDIELISFIAITSYHPVTRQIAFRILITVNELLCQRGIFSSISKMTPSIEKVVKHRLFSYSLIDKPARVQEILPSGLIPLSTALCSHYFDIWSIFLSEIMNVVVEANYLPLILRFRSGKIIAYIKEKVPMVSAFFLSAFFAPELIESISHNYKCTMFTRYKGSNTGQSEGLNKIKYLDSLKDFVSKSQEIIDQSTSKEDLSDLSTSEQSLIDHNSSKGDLIDQNSNKGDLIDQNSKKEDLIFDQNSKKEDLIDQNSSLHSINDSSTSTQSSNDKSANKDDLNGQGLNNQKLCLQNRSSSSQEIVCESGQLLIFPKMQKQKRFPLMYSNSSTNISKKIWPTLPIFSSGSRRPTNHSYGNKGSVPFSSTSSLEPYSSSSTFHVLSNVITLFLNGNDFALAFAVIVHSHVTLYPVLLDILSSIIFSPTSPSSYPRQVPLKVKNVELNSSLITEATRTVAVALRNPLITPVFMIKHLMTHVLKFIAALQGFISNTTKINGPRVILWTESLENCVKEQKELARNYCIIISQLFSIVNSYAKKRPKRKERSTERSSHKKSHNKANSSNNNNCKAGVAEHLSDYEYDDEYDYDYESDADYSEEDSGYEYDYEYDCSCKEREIEEEEGMAALIEENWPIPNREIVFRFLINWSTTTSEHLQSLRELSASALSVIVRVGPLFSDSLLIDVSLLRLFSSLEQDGTSILEPLLYSHLDLLFKNYIEACYTEPQNIADLFFEALFCVFERIRKKYTDLNSFSSLKTTNQKQSKSSSKENSPNKKVTFNLNSNLSLADFNFAFQEMIGSLLLLGLVYTRMNHPRASTFLASLAKIITACIYNRSNIIINSSKRIEEIISNEKNLIQTIHIMFAFATETVIESCFSILSLNDLTVPAKEIIEAIRPWMTNLRLLPKQRNCVPGIPSEFERFTPYQFLEILMKTTEIIDDENFASFSSLWTELMKSPDHSELVPFFIYKWKNPEINKKLLYQLIQTDAHNIVKRLALHCSFAYYYYEFTSSTDKSSEIENDNDNDIQFDEYYYNNKMWFLPLITEAFKNQNEELVQHIPTVVHFAFLFNDVINSAHELLEVLCGQFSINLKHYINKYNNEYQEYLESTNNNSINNSSFEMTDDILIPVVREFSFILSKISEEYIEYWGSECLKWLFGCRNLRIARISLTIFNQILRPIEPLVITGICKSVSFHVSHSSSDINNLTKLVGQAFFFYNAVFEKNNVFSFEFASSFLDCKIFVDSCLKEAAQLFLRSLSSNETNSRAWHVIIGIVRPLLNKLEKDKVNQQIVDLLIKTSQNAELMMIVAPIKIISPHLFTSSRYEDFEDLLNSVSDIVMCKSLVHYATMIETASTQLLNAIYQISTQIVSKVVKNENNRTSLAKIYKSALYNLWFCEHAIEFVTIIANTEPSVATKSVYEFYDWSRSLEDVSRSLVRLLSSSPENNSIVPITDCGTIQSVYNLIDNNNETAPKILPFAAQQEMLDAMKRVRRVIGQKKRRHSLRKATLQQNAQQQQNQMNTDQQQLMNDISWDFEPLWTPDKLILNSKEFSNDSNNRNSMTPQEFVLSE